MNGKPWGAVEIHPDASKVDALAAARAAFPDLALVAELADVVYLPEQLLSVRT